MGGLSDHAHKPLSQVQEQLKGLKQAYENTNEAFGLLRELLQPITNSNIEKKDSGDKVEAKILVPLAEDIRQIKDEIINLGVRIKDLNSSIEI